MIKFKKLILVASASLLIWGCHKDSSISPTTNSTPVNNETTHVDQLMAGNDSNVVVTAENQVLIGQYHDAGIDSVDLDSDGIPDFILLTVRGGSPGSGSYPTAYVASLHANAKISGSYVADTTFAHKDTSYTTSPNGQIYCNITTQSTCERESIMDYVQYVDTTFQPNIFANGDVIHSDSMVDSALFEMTSFSITNTLPPVLSGDTLIHYVNINVFDCNSFPLNTPVYLGLQVNGRLGWLKISISDDASIHVYEHAISQ